VKAKIIREVLNLAQTKPEPDEFDKILGRSNLRRTLRVGAWIKRFIHNCKRKEKKLGPLVTEEIEDARGWWIKQVQQRERETTGYSQISRQEIQEIQYLVSCRRSGPQLAQHLRS